MPADNATRTVVLVNDVASQLPSFTVKLLIAVAGQHCWCPALLLDITNLLKSSQGKELKIMPPSFTGLGHMCQTFHVFIILINVR